MNVQNYEEMCILNTSFLYMDSRKLVNNLHMHI